MAFKLFVTLLLISLASARNFLEKLGNGINEDLSLIGKPIGNTVVGTFSKQCDVVKNVFGLSYERITKGELKVDDLALMYITPEFTINFKLSEAAESIPKTAILDPTKKLFIYLHGFTDNPTKRGFTSLSTALFSQGYTNVLALDGSSMIGFWYLTSTTNVRIMGEQLGATVAALTEMGFDPASIHIIGHSLGAHISGFTGKMFTNLTGKRVGRISGLDPAGPCFTDVEGELRLNSNDADFVDIIHSDAGVFGLTDAIGHVDYYPNNGGRQPGCLLDTCSHSRAWELFAESVSNPTAFPAVQCEDWTAFQKNQCNTSNVSYMGFGSTPGTTGTFFLETNGETPYGRDVNGTTFSNSADGILTNFANYIATN